MDKNKLARKLARKELASWLGVSLESLTFILYRLKIENAYKIFEIPKKSGGTRTICAPEPFLKSIQRKISQKLNEVHLEYLEKKRIKNKISHAFQKDRGIISNARYHRNKRYVLNVDIVDFFSSFHFGRVQGYFNKNKEFAFSKEFSILLAQLVCYKGSLPQGAPSSPVITNLIFNIVDLHILELAKKYKLDYTRYADDLSFSTNSKSFPIEAPVFLYELSRLLEKDGFKINESKTRLLYSSSRQEVTGLTVNKKLNVSRKFIDETRAMAHRLYTTGSFIIDAHLFPRYEWEEDERRKTVVHRYPEDLWTNPEYALDEHKHGALREKLKEEIARRYTSYLEEKKLNG